jgi:hypothetical protein
LNRDKLQLIGRSNCGAIVLVYADDFQDKAKRLVLVNHELQGYSSENFQAYAAAREDQPTSGPAQAAIIRSMQEPPTTDQEFSERLYQALSYYMHDPGKNYLMTEALKGRPRSVWDFINQNGSDSEKSSAVTGLSKVLANLHSMRLGEK